MSSVEKKEVSFEAVKEEETSPNSEGLTVSDLQTVLVLIDTICATGIKRGELRLLADLNDKVSKVMLDMTGLKK